MLEPAQIVTDKGEIVATAAGLTFTRRDAEPVQVLASVTVTE